MSTLSELPKLELCFERRRQRKVHVRKRDPPATKQPLPLPYFHPTTQYTHTTSETVLKNGTNCKMSPHKYRNALKSWPKPDELAMVP